jgi:hypothetical protein
MTAPEVAHGARGDWDWQAGLLPPQLTRRVPVAIHKKDAYLYPAHIGRTEKETTWPAL